MHDAFAVNLAVVQEEGISKERGGVTPCRRRMEWPDHP